MIDVDFHQREFGGHLLRNCESELFQTFNELILESFEQNHNANEFFQKNGWRVKNKYFDNSSGVTKIVFYKLRD